MPTTNDHSRGSAATRTLHFRFARHAAPDAFATPAHNWAGKPSKD
jgi:hypothetical protein